MTPRSTREENTVAFAHLHTEQHDRVLVVRLSNPPLNFLTSAMMEELEQLLGNIAADDSIGGGGTQMLTRALGTARALELCLEGSLLSPQEALAIGLVNRVVPGEQLLAEALAMATRMARRSPDAIRGIKRAVYEAASLPLAAGLEIEKAEFMSVATQAGTRSAMTAYADFVAKILASGRDLGIDDFAQWIEGTAVDFSRTAKQDPAETRR